jgi:hypothetical protein
MELTSIIRLDSFELCLEKHWRTQNAWFHLVTSVIGICVTDAHNNFHSDKSINSVMILSPLLQSPQRQSPRFFRKENLVVAVTEVTVSPLTKSASSRVNSDLMMVKMMELHQHVQQDSTEATGRKIR